MTLVESLQEKFSARIVYGDPVEKDGTVLLPAAWVAGGGGGGSDMTAESAERAGGGFGLFARPSGSWVVTSEGAEWVPAVDLTAMMLAGSVLALSLIRLAGRRRSRRGQ